MNGKIDDMVKGLEGLEKDLSEWRGRIGDPALAENLRRRLVDLGALQFHLRREPDRPPIVSLLGGTGTGKSTLVNRLLEGDFSAASFRRTHTSGPIAFFHRDESLPEGWSGTPHRGIEPGNLPARGEAGTLFAAPLDREILRNAVLVDTPDVDGDAETHYDQAERIFRWSEAVVFLVTPEKYQMTELIPFYRLSKRYEIPARFVMNKCDSESEVEDYRSQLRERGWETPRLFAVPRDDSTHAPAEEMNLNRLRQSLAEIQTEITRPVGAGRGAKSRIEDSLKRLVDQLVHPLIEDAKTVRQVREALTAYVAPAPQVDVSPLTMELQERMRMKSILYLIGPKRIFDRAKQASSTLLTRIVTPGAWFSKKPPKKSQEGQTLEIAAIPDFHELAVDQFRIGQARIRDILAGFQRTRVWEGADEDSEDFGRWMDPEDAGRMVDEEIDGLNQWLKERWDATPRDTQAVLNFLNRFPGGKKIVEWSEASPYLLAAVAAASGAVFGPIDLLFIGGYSLATWLGEKLSNEVTAQVRATNRRLYRRFEELMREQVRRQIEWLESRIPNEDSLRSVEESAEALAGLLESTGWNAS